MLTKAVKTKLNKLIEALCDEGISNPKTIDTQRIEAVASLVNAVQHSGGDVPPIVGFMAPSSDGSTGGDDEE